MKCLSVCQPFADLMAGGAKTIELRRWNTKFRGEFLIHAPSRVRTDDCRRLGVANPETCAIIGKAEMYGVKEYGGEAEVRGDRKLHHAAGGGHGLYGFMVRNAVRFGAPIPCKGRLGFFEARLPAAGRNEIISDIIDEEYRYQWIGRH